MEQVSKELHRPIIKKYPLRHVEVHRIDEIFGADLVDMGFAKDENKPYKFYSHVLIVFQNTRGQFH